jgi:signal transduction histidine kinase
MENIDAELKDEVQEFAFFMHQGGVDLVQQQIEYESPEISSNFYCLMTTDKQILTAVNINKIQFLAVSLETLRTLKSSPRHLLQTVLAPNRKDRFRAIYAYLGSDCIFSMGISLKSHEEFLNVVQNMAVLLLMPLTILAACIGWFLARQAMKGVEDVTLTARQISTGSITRRVSVRQRAFEIDELANTFNHMLDRLQAMIKSIREMSDNIAHDLRSPLTRIRGIAEITLINRDSIEDYREMAASTIEECDKLISIINTMLEITETETGTYTIRTEPIDIPGLIGYACELFEPIAQEKGVQITTSLEDITIRSNKNMLQRLVTNLLENAIKYNRPNGTVSITAAKQGDRVLIQFEDTGIGINEEEISEIFKRFYRGSTARSEPGSGLGLSLAKAIVHRLGGRIQVDSALNKGSVFTIVFPISPRAEALS